MEFNDLVYIKQTGDLKDIERGFFLNNRQLNWMEEERGFTDTYEVH